MSIFGIAGAIGTGKSFLQLLLALEYAEEREKQLVFNFPINLKELEAYCKLPKWIDAFPWNMLFPIIGDHLKPSGTAPRMPWILNLIKNGGISCISNPKNLQALFIPDSVVCLDEAGIYLNSRDFANTPKALLSDLCQSRKDGVDLFWASQFDEQVDKQFRLLTQYWIYADGLSIYDKKMKRPRLVYKKYYWFRAADYFDWSTNRKDKTSHFKTRFAYASKYVGAFLSFSDKQLFKVFNSFSRLESGAKDSFINSIHQSKLSSAYYKSVFLGDYAPSRDPFSSKYSPSLPPPLAPNPVGCTPPAPRAALSYSIKSALSICRSKNISNAPRFNIMSQNDLKIWIDKNI